ncbi:MAG: Ig-like domain-containing protein, partial [Actinomycetota bacterium]
TLPTKGSLYAGGNTTGHKILSSELPYTLTGTTVTYLSTTTANGTDLFTFKANDGLVDSAAATVSVALGDVTPPVVPVITKPAAASLNPKSVAFSGTAEIGSTVKVYEGTTKIGQAAASGTAWNFSLTTLATGSHTVTATATDAAGNVSPASAARTFSVDAQSPGGSLTGPADSSIYLVGQEVIVTGSASDNIGVGHIVVNVRDMNGVVKTYEACTTCPATSVPSWSKSITLGLGYFDIWATIKDTAGNSGVTKTIRVYSAGV